MRKFSIIFLGIAGLISMALALPQKASAGFSPTQQQYFCPKQQDPCPTGAYESSLSFTIAQDPDIIKRKGCLEGDKNEGCRTYFGTPDVINICCLIVNNGKPDCSSYGVGAQCKTSCDSASEDEKNGNCTGSMKCCKPKPETVKQQEAQSQTGSGAACELGPNKAKGVCISENDNYTDKRCKNLRAGNPVLDGGSNTAHCLEPNSALWCCIQDPAWTPPKAAAAKTTTKTAPPTSYVLNNPLGTSSIPVIIGRIIAMFLGIVGAIALLVFVYGGVAWMTARGDAGQVKHAQQAIQGAVLGLIIISGSYLFANSFIKALTEMQVTNIAGTGGGAGGAESTQATTEQTTLEQQQAAASAAAKAKSGGGGAVCVGDQIAAKACQGDCKQFCLNQAKDANVGEVGHPCTNLGQNGCPTDQVCCSWKK